MLDYFHKTTRDKAFYETHIQKYLPDKIIDGHVHMNLPEHVTAIQPKTVKQDWALECGFIMPYEDAVGYFSALFPDKTVEMVAFPWPLPDADIKANNAYLEGLKSQGKITALMTVRPEWPAAYCEEILTCGGFSGFKPYPYMASSIKGAEVSIFEFLPHAQLQVLEKHKKAVVLHLPRRGRLADDANVREIKEIVERYPNVKVVLAHLGRCFNYKYFEEGIAKLGDTRHAVYYDTSAVLNPTVYRAAFDALGTERILFGTDAPILLWHGRRKWTEAAYFNLCRENFSWNTHEEPEKEAEYTFFIYEQIKAILDMLKANGGNPEDIRNIFYKTAERVYFLP